MGGGRFSVQCEVDVQGYSSVDNVIYQCGIYVVIWLRDPTLKPLNKQIGPTLNNIHIEV